MLDVASLQQFDFFANFTLCAGTKGLYRTISNVVVLDHEGLEEDFGDFHKGDFVITNLFYAKDNPDKIFSSFSQLMDIGISAIAIKSIFFHELPHNIILLAEKCNVPIFFFHSIYIEDVILNITDYLRSSTNYNYYENLIDALLHKDNNDSIIKNILSEMLKEHHSFLSCMYISYKDAIDDFSIQRNLNNLQHKKSNLDYQSDFYFVKYKKGILFLYFFKEELSPLLLNQKWDNTFFDLDIKKAQFYIGISDELVPIKKAEIAIQRSLYSTKCCILESTDKKNYSDLNINNLILPICESAYIKAYLTDLYDLIKSNESQQNNHLSETLKAYVLNNFHIDHTSQMLFQHPNTIRYRINKIKSMIGIEDDFEFHMISLLMIKIL